jgi:hypothetical protein
MLAKRGDFLFPSAPATGIMGLEIPVNGHNVAMNGCPESQE